MKKRAGTILSLFLIIAMLLNITATTLFALPPSSDISAASGFEIDYTQYVNVFNGTGGDHGQLSPAAQVPHGLVKLGPDTWPKPSGISQSGYNFHDYLVRGFSHTRVEGTGNVGSGGDVRIMPSLSMPTAGFDPDLNGMYKANEYAEVGYYKTDLLITEPTYSSTDPDEKLLEVIETDPDTTISVELTADVRTGYHKYVFPTDTAYFYVDLGDAFAGRPEGGAYMEITGSNSLAGYVIGGNVTGRTTNFYKLYFTLEFNRDFSTVSLYDNSEALTANTSELGENVGAVLSFDDAASDAIYAKVTLSPISVEQAQTDMATEAPGWDFGAVRASAKADWQELLSRVAIEDSRNDEHTEDLIEMFYTSLYRMLTIPVNVTSTSGTYMGSDGNVHDANGYTHYDGWSLWDDYRKYPLISIFAPELYRDIVRSIADLWIHRYENGRGTYYAAPHVGYEHSVTLIADGIAKGIWFDDMDLIYEAMKSTSGRFKSGDRKLGYITGSEAVSDTLEYAYDDYCQALIAKALAEKALDDGNTEKYEYYESEFKLYISGSLLYRNLWLDDATVNESTGEKIGLFAPKDEVGNWVDFDPLAFGPYAYEGGAWQWRWCTPHDVLGAAKLAGGTDKMLEDLTYFFNNNWFTAVNETDLHAPYMFNYLGAPHLTQKWVHNVYTEATTQVFHNHGKYSEPVTDFVYKNQMECFPASMDDDTGTMSAMFFAATLGLFPFVAGDGTFQIGSPAFEKVTISSGAGKTLVIEADNVSRDNYYIQSATINGKSTNRTWLDYSEIVNGGTLTFKMGNEPSDWAADGLLPISASQIADDRLEDLILNNPTYKDPDDSINGTDISTEGGYSTPEEYDILSDYLAYWSFDGTLADKGGAYDITSSATPSYSEGMLGNAIQVSSSIALKNSDHIFGFGTDDFSASVWFTTSGNGNILGREETTSNHGWCLRVDGGYLQFSAHDNSKYRIASTTLVNDNVWHHAALTVKDGVAYLYLDGTLVGTTTGFGSLDIDDYSTTYDVPFSIGHRSQVRSGVLSTGNPFTGLIDEVKIYDRALSSSSITALYNAAESTEEEGGSLNVYWPFDGSTADSDGEYEFSASSTAAYATGKFDNALSLSGNYALTSSDSAFDFGSGDFAVALWVNVSAVENKTIVGKADTSLNTGWALRVDGGVFQLSINDNVTKYGVASTEAVEAGRWYHLAAVRSGESVYLYIDGVCVGSNSAIGTASLSSTADLAVGARISGGTLSSYIKASVDDLRIYGRSLSDTDIADLYNLAPVKPGVDAPADYIAYWMLNGNLDEVRDKYNLSSSIEAHGFTDSMNGFGSALGNVSNTGSAPFSDSTDFDFGSESFTLSLWYKVPDNSNATTIISKEDYGTNKAGWSLRINNGYLQFNTPKNTNYRISIDAPTANEWHHVIVSRDGTALCMYVDGELVGTKAIGSFSLTCDNPLRLGARTTNGNPVQYLNGFIDDVKIYRRAVSNDEAVSLYNEIPSSIIFIDGNDTFREGTADGSLAGVIVDTVTIKLATGEELLDGELTYTSVDAGSEIVFSDGDPFAKIWGLTDGLTPVFTRIDSKTIEISLTGSAIYNDGALGEALHIEINPAYLLKDGTPLTSESRIVGDVLDIPIKLYAGKLNYSHGVLEEAVSGSGVLGTVITVTITDESGSGKPAVGFKESGPVIGKDIIIENLPEGIYATAELGDDEYTLYIAFTGSAASRVDVNDISVVFEQSAFSDSAKVVYNIEKRAITADLDNLKLWYSESVLYEADAGDGSFSESITVRLTDMKFAGLDGNLLPISVSGLPDGLSASAVRLGDYEAQIIFNGKALYHALSDSVTVKVAFDEGALMCDSTEHVEGLSDEIALRFKNPTVRLSDNDFVESPENDGSIYLPIYATLADDKESFFGTPGEDFIKNGKLEIYGLSDGLSAEAILLSDGRIRITLIGNATSHDHTGNVHGLTMAFSDDAFMGWKADEIIGSTVSTLSGPDILYTEQAGTACGHSFGAADCDNPMTCTACGYMMGEALGHSYSFKTGVRACDTCGDVIELPYDNDTYMNYRWELAEDGESYTTVFDPAFNPYVNLTLFRDISLNIVIPYSADISKMSVSAIDGYDKPVSVRTFDGAMNVNGTLYHKMQISGIDPSRIDERFTVSFDITGRYGELVTKSFKISIEDYLDKALDKNSSADNPIPELEEMLEAIKAYGNAAKIYVEGGEFDTDVDDFSGYIDAVNPAENDSFTSASLNLDEGFNWYIETVADEVYATYYYNGILMENVKLGVKDGKAKLVLKARDLLKTVTVSAGDDEISFNFTYYAKSIIEASKSNEDMTERDVMSLKGFLDAIYRYADSAESYSALMAKGG